MNSIILSHKKLGSIYFLNCMYSHPDTKSYTELFRSWKNTTEKTDKNKHFFHFFKGNEKEYIEWLFNNDKTVTFLLRYYHCNKKIEDVIRDMNIPIIHHCRRNKLKQVISLQLPGQSKGTVSLGPEKILEKVIMLEDKEKMFDEKFKDNRMIKIYYEDMIGKDDKEKTYMNERVNKELCDFLEINNFLMFAPKRKQTIKQKSENIWNYIKDKEGVIDIFKKNGRMSYLEGNI